MTEQYYDYCIETSCRKMKNGRYTVGVVIKKEINGKVKTMMLKDTRTSLILKEEAEKEAINFGKNLIKNNIVGF